MLAIPSENPLSQSRSVDAVYVTGHWGAIAGIGLTPVILNESIINIIQPN